MFGDPICDVAWDIFSQVLSSQTSSDGYSAAVSTSLNLARGVLTKSQLDLKLLWVPLQPSGSSRKLKKSLSYCVQPQQQWHVAGALLMQLNKRTGLMILIKSVLAGAHDHATRLCNRMYNYFS